MLEVGQEKSGSHKIFVTIAGNIGSGKTTLTEILARRLGWEPKYESVIENPYLADFYQDMKMWSFPLQVYFLNHRYQCHRQIERSRSSAIQDRSIYEDKNIFARALFEQGDLSERDYENYLNLYGSLTSTLRPPTLLIYLQRSLDNLMERIGRRGRDFEKNICPDYLTRLNGYYDDWFERYNLGNKLCINTDGLDFLHNDADFSALVENMFDQIGQRDLLLQ